MNTNETVWVRLNDVGWARFDAFYRDLRADLRARMPRMSPTDTDPIYRTENRDTWQHFQLWDLMAIFGPVMGVGWDIPFVDNEIMLTNPEAVPCAG